MQKFQHRDLNTRLRACGDTAHRSQAGGLDFGPPVLQVQAPSLKVWWCYQVLWTQTAKAEYAHTERVDVWTVIYK